MTQVIKQLGMKSRITFCKSKYLVLFFLVTVAALECLGLCKGIRGQSDIRADARQTISGIYQGSNRILAPGKAITGQLKKGETITFDIIVPKPSQFLQVRIKQKGTDIGFALRAATGQVLAAADKPNSGLRDRLLLRVLNEAGTYRLEIHPLIDSEIGCYEVGIEQLRNVDSKDENRINSYNAFAEAELLKAKRTPSDLSQSIVNYQQALSLRPAEDREEVVRILNGLGEAYYYSANMTDALKFYNQAVSLAKEANLPRWGGEALNNVGVVYVTLSKNDQALDYMTQALELRRTAGDHFGEIDTLTNIGYVYSALGDQKNSENTYKKALALIEEPCDRFQKAPILNNLGSLLYDQGDFQDAIDYYLPSLSIFHEMGDESMEAGVLNNLATCYYNMGEGQSALDYYNRARPLVEKLSDQITQGTLLNNIGLLYSALGQNETALQYFKEARPHWLKPLQPRGLAFTLEWIGGTYTLLGRSREALEPLMKARELFHEAKDLGNEAYSMAHLAETYADLRQRQKALVLLGQALLLVKDRDPQARAYVLITLGEQHAALRQTELALKEYAQALAIVHASKDIQEEATVLRKIGLAEQSRGNLAAAHTNFQKALDLIESVRTNVISHNLRASYLSSKQVMYNSDIDLLMQWHRREPNASHDAEALHTAERGRARSLMELLTESKAELSQGIKPEFLTSLERLQQQITAKTALRSELAQDKSGDAQRAKLNGEIASLSNQLEQIEAQIKSESPRYAALVLPQPLTASQIQNKVLDADTVLLEYKLGSKRSYLWVVTSGSVNSYELPQRSVIEALARQVYQYLTERSRKKVNESLTGYDRRVRNADNSFYAAARKLSLMLLSPATKQLKRKRLLIVSEGILQYIPFAALPIPNESIIAPGSPVRGQLQSETLCSSPTKYCPMANAYEIVTAASASTIAVLQDEFRGRKVATKTVAVFADPVVDLTDQRIKQKNRPANQIAAKRNTLPNSQRPESTIIRSLRSTPASNNRQSLERLKYSKDEANAIEDLVPPDMRSVARDFQVNHQNATSPDLDQYRFIHFSTHGLLDSKQPELSGVFLSLWDRDGRFQEDGILRLGEVYNLKLNADVVTLSACETALGRQIDGEGIIGLTRGFMYAGSRSVVASLWLVDDKATSELMKSFYSGMLGPAHLAPAAALRRAQIEFLVQAKQADRASPYFWGGFIHQGLWSVRD